MKNILFLMLVFLVFQKYSKAQDALYNAPNSSIHSFGGQNVSVWGNIYNNGSWGSSPNARILVYSDTFFNNLNAAMPGTGIFIFEKPRPSPYYNVSPQYLKGGYDAVLQDGCSFPHIRLNNLSHLNLFNDLNFLGNDTKIRDTVNFINGSIILNKNEMVVGNNAPGAIVGYTEKKFFVTNGEPTDNIGFLRRENISMVNGTVVFPVGNGLIDYTPANIYNTGIADDFSFRVFLDAYENSTSGALHNDETVARSWEIKEVTQGGTIATIGLQHNKNTEGTSFAARRLKHYITHFTGFSPNGPGNGNGVDTISRSKWDLLKYFNLNAGISPGPITSGTITIGSLTEQATIADATLTTRSNISNLGIYTKTVYNYAPLPVKLTRLDAVWNNENGHVIWQTATELNNSHFIVERSPNNIDFEKAGEVKGKSIGGNSNTLLDYSFNDINIKSKVSNVVYYRLRQVDFNGQEDVYGPVALTKNAPRKDNLKVFPNPASEVVNVRIDKIPREAAEILFCDQVGRVLIRTDANTTEKTSYYEYNVSEFSKGVYFVSYISQSGIITKKVVIN